MRYLGFLIIIWGLYVNTTYANFNDLPSTHPAYNALLYLKHQGAISGYEDGSVRAENPVTRAELAKILSTLRGIENKTCKHPFTDIKKEDWFYSHICNNFTKGIIKGYDDKTFRPGNRVNFVESAKMILLSLEIPTPPAAPENRWFEPFAGKLGQRKAIPISIDAFDHVMTRGEVAEIIYRLKRNVTNKPSRGGNLALFQWPKNATIISKDPQYRPFTNEDYEQSLGNHQIGLFFRSDNCLECTNIDQELTKRFGELPVNTVVFKVDFEDNLYPRIRLDVKNPNRFSVLNIHGGLIRTIEPKSFGDILEAFTP